jgi:hypothetical protein
MEKLYRGPYIDAYCQVWFHLAKLFQRRRLKYEKVNDCQVSDTGSVGWASSFSRVSIYYGNQTFWNSSDQVGRKSQRPAILPSMPVRVDNHYLKNSNHLEWRVGLSDTILKGTHPGTIYAKFGSIWPSCFRGEDFLWGMAITWRLSSVR